MCNKGHLCRNNETIKHGRGAGPVIKQAEPVIKPFSEDVRSSAAFPPNLPRGVRTNMLFYRLKMLQLMLQWNWTRAVCYAVRLLPNSSGKMREDDWAVLISKTGSQCWWGQPSREARRFIFKNQRLQNTSSGTRLWDSPWSTICCCCLTLSLLAEN